MCLKMEKTLISRVALNFINSIAYESMFFGESFPRKVIFEKQSS